ncbi:MAG: PfkB family carbohydrate kinase [Candidatus Omnitrophota bacterium]
MFDQYKHKIKTPEKIRESIGPFPREKKAIMCHGTFDIVHPGHLRHLMYAKERADVLIASITCDEYIPKGPYRPFVPEDLRAANLSALEMVDYVVIDRNPTPIENIRLIQPDLFAKGFEYSEDGIHPKTREEINALESYGGELLFTPGDIVYSSTALLKHHIPNLAIEKLLVLMEAENVDFADFRKTLRQLSGFRVHVIGDTIVDKYTQCSILGAAQDAPTFSIKKEYSESYPGGAAIVAMHVRSLGARVIFSTMLGNDAVKDFVLNKMKDAEIQTCPVIDKTRPTVLKERFMVENYRMVQVDDLDNRIISEKNLKKICDNIQSGEADVYIFSDFRHGLFHPTTINEMREILPASSFKAADSQVSSRWGNILDFNHFDLITPNEREVRYALGDQDSVIRPLAYNLYERANCRYMILKMGERGLLAYRGLGISPRNFFILDSFVHDLVDPVGAGDTLLAVSSLALAQSNNILIASVLGSLAAAAACERKGNTPITIQQIEEKLDSIEKSVN